MGSECAQLMELGQLNLSAGHIPSTGDLELREVESPHAEPGQRRWSMEDCPRTGVEQRG
jgi:hypothetical protein